VPTYEYVCRSCGEHCEVVQSFKDAPLTECPNCQGELRKVFGNIGIAFKGSGFYKTDSRSKSSAAKASEGSSSEAAKSDAKSDAKPDGGGGAKADSKGDSKPGGSKPKSDAKSTPSAASAS
jgi:putative FmdB family regulatory protein